MPQVLVNEQTVWYNQFGTGKNIVLMIPGAIGTAQSDFEIQFDSSNENCLDFNNFTFICVELPGWGKSIPPKRNYGPNVLHNDADCCIRMMELLGYQTYSVFGWSEGAKVALIVAHKAGKERVKSLVLQGIITYGSEIGTRNILWSRNVNNWNPEMLQKYVKAYDNSVERVAKLWDTHMDFIAKFSLLYPQGILGPIENGLAKVQCPTLVLHGDRDFFVEFQQAEHVAKNVPNCRLVRFANSAHNLHQTEPAKFRQVMEKFLLNE